ncbi:MAG: hypothetical protein BWY99_02614 [Synergistetes bacterium ADurb.BinA166]|nr:MAG: hypothetical protein BWY99_02614 [Synergistetes bacterium ADurb.BinA166]
MIRSQVTRVRPRRQAVASQITRERPRRQAVAGTRIAATMSRSSRCARASWRSGSLDLKRGRRHCVLPSRITRSGLSTGGRASRMRSRSRAAVSREPTWRAWAASRLAGVQVQAPNPPLQTVSGSTTSRRTAERPSRRRCANPPTRRRPPRLRPPRLRFIAASRTPPPRASSSLARLQPPSSRNT